MSSKVVTFYSPQGGAGKSTLAVNTALFLAAKGVKTLLIDMAQYGTVVSMLKMKVKNGFGLSGLISMMDLMKEKNSGNEFLGDVVNKNVEKGVVFGNLDVLVGTNPIKLEALKTEYIESIFNYIEESDYEAVIIDTSSEICVRNLMLIEKSDRIIAPVIQDVSCGWKMFMLKDILESIRKPIDKVNVVVNRCSKHSGFYNQEYETEIGFSIILEMPEFAKNFQSYLNMGKRVTEKFNKKAHGYFEELADKAIKMG